MHRRKRGSDSAPARKLIRGGSLGATAEVRRPPAFALLKKANGQPGAWHWIKQHEETRTTYWLITGCGKGMYANDDEVLETKTAGAARIFVSLCRRCNASSTAFYRKRGRKSKSRAVKR